MIDYNELLESSKRKQITPDGSDMTFTEYYSYNIEGSKTIAINNILHFDAFEMTEHQKEICENLTVATSVMNREEFLIESLASWIRFPFKKIVIVDWSSNTPISKVLKDKGIDDDRIHVVRIDDQKFYEHSLARNEKMKHTDGWVLSIDSDVVLSPIFGSTLHFGKDKKVIYMNSISRADKALHGTSIFHKDEYDSVGGCNSDIHGWGTEDTTLYSKMIDNGCKKRDMRTRTMYHIPHDDYLRTVNTKYDNIYTSLASNNISKAV